MPGVRLEIRFVLFPWCQPNLVIASSKVELGKPASAGQFTQNFLDDGNRVLTDNGQSIKAPVIRTHMRHVPSLFFTKMMREEKGLLLF